MSDTKKKNTPGTSTISEERTATIEIGGHEYELVLTTRATREIASRFGGLENLGDKLQTSESFDQALEDIIWLITLLANQSILIHNLTHDDTKETLSTDQVELLTAPGDLAGYKEAITEALMRGTKRNIVSEHSVKNG